MKHLKKFESYEANQLQDEILEYFIDMDKNHGGRWDVDVSSKFVEGERKGKPSFYKIEIQNREGGDLDLEFLKELKARIDQLLSIGDFYLYNGGRSGVGDPNNGRGNFGFFFLTLYKIDDSKFPYNIPPGGSLLWHPVVEIDNNTISNIKAIKDNIRNEYYRTRNKFIEDSEMDNLGISLGSISLWFISKNDYKK